MILTSSLLLYIDPSTGSMLFAVIVGMVSALFFGFRSLMMKLKSSLGVDVKSLKNSNKINIVIFSDHKRYWNVFGSICDEFEKRGIEVHYWTMSNDDPGLTKPYKHVKCEFIGMGNKAFAKLNLMNAKICLSTTPGIDVYQWKRSRGCDLYAHILHSPGLNRGGYRMFGMDYFDVILSASDNIHFVREIEKKRNLPEKDIIVVGSTYLDELKKRYDSSERVHNDKKVVLVAPSWGTNSILEKYGSGIIDEVIKTGYQVIVRPHPQTVTQNPHLLENLQAKYPNIEWNYDNDNFNVLNKSDIMISDFSGVIFDYSMVFDKPVIHTKFDFDWSEYDGAILDDNSWTDKALAKFSVELNDENLHNLKSIIDDMITNDKYVQGREEVKNQIWQNRGNASVAVVDYLVNKLNSME